MEPKPMFLAGKWTRTGDIRTITSPWSGDTAGSCCLAGPGEMEKALAAAEAAFPRTRAIPSHERSRICREIARLIGERAGDFTRLITAETGKPVRYSRAEADRARTTFSLASDAALDPLGEVLPADLDPGSAGYLALALRVPRGPVAAIAPFNFPLNLVAHKVAPAFACGCPVVLKPPPRAPLTSLLLAELAEMAGAPAGMLSVLPCDVPLAERMVKDVRIRTLSFTGSAAVGWRLRELAGRKQVLLELGGNAAAVVHGDADWEWAAGRLAAGAFANAGQVCISVQRIYVQEELYPRFRERFLVETARLPVGDPAKEETVAGPVIDRAAADRVESWVEEARKAGAAVHAFGKRHGNLLPLFVLEKVPRSMKVCCEEVFGPVAVLAPYGSFDEAVVLVNEGAYGLQAGVFTRDLARAVAAAWGLEVGGVILNDYPTFRVDNLPYGGSKDSGLGREGVRYAMEAMCETRTVVIRGGRT